MTYFDRWHKPEYCLAMCKRGFDAVLRDFTGLGWESPDFVSTGCCTPTTEGEPCDEGCPACSQVYEFTSSPCEVCGTSLAGSRYAIAVIEPGTKRESLYYSVCYDCYYYCEYGTLDDQSMLDIAEALNKEPTNDN